MHDTTPKNARPPAPPRRVYKRVWQRNKRREDGVKEVELAPCGTVAAYRRHLRKESEEVDVFCNAAHNADARRTRAAARLRTKQDDLAAAVEAEAPRKTISAIKADIAQAKADIAQAKADMEAARLAAEAAADEARATAERAQKKTRGSRTKAA